MQKRAKIEVFGQYLQIGASNGLDVVYHDSRKCFSASGNGKGSCMINYICIISMIFAKMSQKLRFLSTSLSLVGWIGLILLTLIDRVDIQLLILSKVLVTVMIYA